MLALGVFANSAGGRPVGYAVVDLLPSLATVVGAEQVRAHVVETERVYGSVSGLRVKMAGIHFKDLPERLQLGRGDIVPMRAGIGCGPYETIIGACPQTGTVHCG